jgi:hypothetical protein
VRVASVWRVPAHTRGGPRAPGSGRRSRTPRGVVSTFTSYTVIRLRGFSEASRALQSLHDAKKRCYLSDLTSTTCHALIRAPPTNQADKIKAMPEFPNERGRGRT